MGVVSREDDESNRDIFGETALKPAEMWNLAVIVSEKKNFFSRSERNESLRGRFFPSRLILRMGRPLSRAAVPGRLLPVVCLRFFSRRLALETAVRALGLERYRRPGEPLPYIRSNRFCSAVFPPLLPEGAAAPC